MVTFTEEILNGKLHFLCNEINRQLNDTNNYEQFNLDPTDLHTEKIKSEINNLKYENLLTSKTANSLLEGKKQTPEFHLLPKMHKANNPGRPVISSVNCHTNRISKFDQIRRKLKKSLMENFTFCAVLFLTA